ncbi:aldose 1-epimerase family protein [Liquorilactobacillus nagelii]|uniref:aldose 1-epimerase family protein n=1 Tax=Liquorilactobacillus nagelii TaxID=82688 RepID=UPI001CCB138D|nr:aldose 1-epimerase family protein [Liquorilactobacillus nagelii]ULQ49507.1 aldose 1-epimerase family protein [Liquorilactobacillus nagelii]
MEVYLENEQVKATFSNHGAELQSLFNKDTQIEYLWQADAKFWGRHAPVLFPFVGRLKDDQYCYGGENYEMHQHGFARDSDFEVIEKDSDHLIFELNSSATTKAIYPFDFKLRIGYFLQASALKVSYQVENLSDEKMLFSIGGHPAFNVPLQKDESFDDYLVEFQPVGNYLKIPLVGNYTDISAAQDDRMAGLRLTRTAFKKDALIYQLAHPVLLELTTTAHRHGVRLDLPATEYVGIWSPYPAEAPFVCIEPWWGLADDLSSTGELQQKRGIHELAQQQLFNASYTISIF